MGAFMVVHGKAKIRFAYMLFVSLKPRVGTFEAKAYVMLLLWLASETFWALLGSATAPRISLTWAASPSAQRWPSVSSARGVSITASTPPSNRRLRAGRMTAYSKREAWPPISATAEAFALLDQAARDLPHSIDVQLEMLRLAQESRDRPRSSPPTSA